MKDAMLQKADIRPAHRIAEIRTDLVDLPFRRLQRFARLDARAQTSLLVRVRAEDGVEGLGESVVPCGPWWSGDSAESMKALIDVHLAPAAIGLDSAAPGAVMAALDRVAHGAAFAKAGLEMACLDLDARRLGAPLATLLGGALRDRVPVAWPLASGTDDGDLAEIEEMLAAGRAAAFKAKMGAEDPGADLDRLARLADAIAGRAALIVDPNESWSEADAIALLPRLADLGVAMVEQPVPREQGAALARLAARSAVPIMVDEGAQTEAATLSLACAGAAQVISLKVMKAGGLMPSRRMADIAHAGGMALYLGTFLETSIGTAASLHLGAVLPELARGGEVVGPMLLAEDIVTEPIAYAGGAAEMPAGPGLGVTLDEAQIRAFRRR